MNTGKEYPGQDEINDEKDKRQERRHALKGTVGFWFRFEARILESLFDPIGVWREQLDTRRAKGSD